MRSGAHDSFKALENPRLLTILRTQVELSRLFVEESAWKPRTAAAALRASQLIAESAMMSPVLALISRVGPSDANV